MSTWSHLHPFHLLDIYKKRFLFTTHQLQGYKPRFVQNLCFWWEIMQSSGWTCLQSGFYFYFIFIEIWFREILLYFQRQCCLDTPTEILQDIKDETICLERCHNLGISNCKFYTYISGSETCLHYPKTCALLHPSNDCSSGISHKSKI